MSSSEPQRSTATSQSSTQEPAGREAEAGTLRPKTSVEIFNPVAEQDGGTSVQPPADIMMDSKRQDEQKDNAGAGALGTQAGLQSSDSPDQQEGEVPTKDVEKLSVSNQRKSRAQSLRLNTNPDSPPIPPSKDETYLDPTPKTPQAPQSPLGTPNEYTDKELPDVPSEKPDERMKRDQRSQSEGRKSEESQAEIQSIMGQFTGEAETPKQGGLTSPRLELAEQFLAGQAHFPPRKSSLEPIRPGDTVPDDHQLPIAWRSRPNSIASNQQLPPPAVPPKSPPTSRGKTSGKEVSPSAVGATSPPGPPPPEPEPDQPFDFHRFLEQLRHRTADPVAKFLRSFLTEFGKKQWMVHEQVKIISDFLAFITNKMAQCEVWREVSDVEFDNAKEGMEKLVMNRLYSQTFSPAIPPPPAPSRSRSRSRKKELERLHGPGRRGQHQEDVERDEVLAQKIRIYSWIKEEHLDIPPVGPNGRRFLTLAQQELLKIKGYRAPRDKVICVLNCCKVIFGLLRNAKSGDTSADSFVPLLIYVVLKANPEHLVSNIQYILRFRNQEKLSGEAGYYLSSLSGAIQFIETLDRTSLTVTDEEFEKNVEAAVSEIAERNKEADALLAAGQTSNQAEAPPRDSVEEYQRRKDISQTSGSEDNPAVAGLLRTIQKPLTTIGRMFTDESESQGEPQRVSQQQAGPGLSAPAYNEQQEGRRSGERQRGREGLTAQQISRFDAQEAAARQASAEAAEARRIQRAEHNDVVETLSGMFPNLDKDVIDDVVRMKEGRVGLAVDACLALSAE